jgi:hypothetical protein
MNSFEREWRQRYGTAEPIPHALRTRDGVNWVRFHSLPASKRYPENDEEWSILFSRLAALASEVLGAEGVCWLVMAEPEAARPGGEVRSFGPFEAYRFRDPHGIYGVEGQEWMVSAASATWSLERFEVLLRRIANDEGPRALWMSEADGAIFAPYDGGVDLFFAEPTCRDAIAAKYPDWLSERSDGL